MFTTNMTNMTVTMRVLKSLALTSFLEIICF